MHNFCCSHISVKNATALTNVSAFSKSFCGYTTAFRTYLTCSQRINFDIFDTSLFSFVPQIKENLCPRGIVNMLGEHAFGKPFDVKILNRNSIKALNNTVTKFVAEITPLVGSSGAINSQTCYSFCPYFRSSLTTCYRPLSTTQSFAFLFRPSMACIRFAGTKSHYASKPEINADAVAYSPVYLWHNIDVKRDKPLTSSPSDDCRLRTRGQRSMPTDAYFTRNAFYMYLSRFAKRQPLTDAKFSSVKPFSRAKPWKPAFTFEKSVKRFVNSSKNLLLSGKRPLSKISFGEPYAFQFRRLVGIPKRFTLTPECLYTLLQSRIIQIAKVFKHRIKHSLLRFINFQTILICEEQNLTISHLLCANSHKTMLCALAHRIGHLTRHPAAFKSR